MSASLDRAATAALTAPLLDQLHTVAAPDRAAWITSLARGLADGMTPGADHNPDAHAIGRRMAFLLTEQGHA